MHASTKHIHILIFPVRSAAQRVFCGRGAHAPRQRRARRAAGQAHALGRHAIRHPNAQASVQIDPGLSKQGAHWRTTQLPYVNLGLESPALPVSGHTFIATLLNVEKKKMHDAHSYPVGLSPTLTLPRLVCRGSTLWAHTSLCVCAARSRTNRNTCSMHASTLARAHAHLCFTGHDRGKRAAGNTTSNKQRATSNTLDQLDALPQDPDALPQDPDRTQPKPLSTMLRPSSLSAKPRRIIHVASPSPAPTTKQEIRSAGPLSEPPHSPPHT